MRVAAASGLAALVAGVAWLAWPEPDPSGPRASGSRKGGVVAHAASELCERGLRAAEVVRACADLAGSEAPFWHRRRALELLGRYGTQARPALPVLIAALDDPPFGGETILAETFAALPELADATVPALVGRAASGDEVALAALAALQDRVGARVDAEAARLPLDRRQALEAALEKQRRAR